MKRTNYLNEIFFKPAWEAQTKIDNFKKLLDGVYIYKNFMPEDMKNYYKFKLSELTVDDWTKVHNNYEHGDIDHKWEHGKISQPVVYSHGLDGLLSSFFSPDLINCGRFPYFIRLQQGDDMELNNGMPLQHKTTQLNNDMAAQYKVGLYLGDWSGGELCIPEINFEIKPEENDLIIWKYGYDHYIKEITSGTRYSYCDYLTRPPGFWVA
jgi:hypothetical protein